MPCSYCQPTRIDRRLFLFLHKYSLQRILQITLAYQAKDISLTNKAFCSGSTRVDSKLSSLKEDVDLSINNQIKDLKDLEVKIDQQQDILNKKRDRLSDDLIEDREFEISMKQQCLERLQSNTSQMKKKIVYRKFNQWKGRIKSQIGKKKKKAFDKLCSRERHL